jgi:PAS domain S-box-containing protein
VNANDLLLLTATDVLESMEEAFYAVDRDWRFVYVNRGAEAFWHRDRRELLGRSMLDAFPSFPGSGPHQAHQAAMSAGQRTRVETVSTVTGTPVELNFQPTEWGLAVYFRDITERRRLERELRDRADILALAEESAGIGVWEVDLATRRVRGTAQFFRIHGLPVSEAGVPVSDFRAVRHPDDRARVTAGFERAMSGGADTYESEYRIKLPDGQTRWIFGRGRIVRNAAGELTRYSGVDLDITDRKRGEEVALRLASLVESSDDAIIGLDLKGLITSWNDGASRLYGYGREEVLGQAISLLIPPDFADDERQILERVGRGERLSHFETRRRRKDGTLVDISLTVSPIRDASGRIVGASKISRDVSERKEAQKRQALLLREMSHRVKNAFALAGAIVSSAGRETSDPAELVESARNRIGALARAHNLILPDSNADPERLAQTTTIGALVEAVLSPFLGDAEAERFSWAGPETKIGAGRLTSIALILHELATNSAKHGAISVPRGTLEVRWEFEAGERLKLTWLEQNCPPRGASPLVEGFGSQMLRAAASQLGGTITWHWKANGVSVNISADAKLIEPA